MVRRQGAQSFEITFFATYPLDVTLELCIYRLPESVGGRSDLVSVHVLTDFGAILPLAAYWHQDGDTALFSRGLGRSSARPFRKFLVTGIDCVENGYLCINRPKNAAPFVLMHKRPCDTNTVLTRYPVIVGVYFPRRT